MSFQTRQLDEEIEPNHLGCLTNFAGVREFPLKVNAPRSPAYNARGVERTAGSFDRIS
jgi:hypothetical protein